jgi:hypothetical protein
MKAPKYRTAASRLRLAIEEVGQYRVSMRMIAERCGLNPSELSNILTRLEEQGDVVQLRRWNALREGFGVDRAWWLDGQGEPDVDWAKVAEGIHLWFAKRT